MSVATCPSDVVTRIAKALGLPNNIRSFELRVANGEMVTCKVELFPNIDIGDFETALTGYHLVRDSDD